MPLPKIATPTYELELPSTGKSIKYRPFLVKEEKVLVIALESEDTKQITNAIKAVLKNCVLTKGIKVETLPTFDIEYLFLNIRGKSVGEELEVNIVCPDDGETNVPIFIDLDSIQVKKDDDHTNQIKLEYTSQFNNYHQIKFGIDLQKHELELDSYALMDSSQNDKLFTPIIPSLGDNIDFSGNKISQLTNKYRLVHNDNIIRSASKP